MLTFDTHSLHLCQPQEPKGKKHIADVLLSHWNDNIKRFNNSYVNYFPVFSAWIKPYPVFYVRHLSWSFSWPRSPLAAVTEAVSKKKNKKNRKFINLTLKLLKKIAFYMKFSHFCFFSRPYFSVNIQNTMTFVLEQILYLCAVGFSCFRVSMSVNCTDCPPPLVLKTFPWGNFKGHTSIHRRINKETHTHNKQGIGPLRQISI